MDKLDFSALQSALTSLEQTLKILNPDYLKQQPDIVRDTLIAGAIQKFEFCYELAIKSLKKQLQADSHSVEAFDLTQFRQILRAGFEKGLIDSVEDWFVYRDMRNITSHTYQENKALAVFAQIPVFLLSAKTLCQKLNARQSL